MKRVCVTIALMSLGPAQMCFIALSWMHPTIHLVTVNIGVGYIKTYDWLEYQLGSPILLPNSNQIRCPDILFIFFLVSSGIVCTMT